MGDLTVIVPARGVAALTAVTAVGVPRVVIPAGRMVVTAGLTRVVVGVAGAACLGLAAAETAGVPAAAIVGVGGMSYF